MKNTRPINRNTSSDSSMMPFVFGAIAGGVIGAALALLYAPAEGTEIRKGVGEKFDDLTDGINDILKSAKVSAEKMLSEGKTHPQDEVEGATRYTGSSYSGSGSYGGSSGSYSGTSGSGNGMSSGTGSEGTSSGSRYSGSSGSGEEAGGL